jgi:hypothetical protein
MKVLAEATKITKNYGIEFVTIQMEDVTMDGACGQKESGLNSAENKQENGHGHH